MAGDEGIKISEAGYDVRIANDRQLSLKTDFTLLKVALSGTVVTNALWTEVVHNLGYVPQFLVFFVGAGGKTFFATAVYPYVARADDNKLYILKYTAGGLAYYYIFYEQA